MLENIIALGIPIALAGMVFGGAGDFLAAIASRRLGSFRSLFWVDLATLVFGFVYIIFFRISIFEISSYAIFLSIIVGILHTVGGLLFFQGMKVGKVGLTTAITSLSSFVVVIFAFLFLGEQATILQIFAIAFLIIGAFVASINLKEILSSKISFSDPGVRFALYCPLFYGTGWILFREAVIKAHFAVVCAILFLTVIVCLLLYSRIKNISLQVPGTGSEWMYCLVSGFLFLVAYFTYGAGLGKYMASIITSVGGAYPLVAILLAWIFLKEKITRVQFLGILGIVGGVILLSV